MGRIVINIIQIIVVYGTILLLLQFCINNILDIFSQPGITFLQTFSGFVLFCLSVHFMSLSWHKGK